MGMSEILIICAVALLVFGPDQLPQMVKKIAKGLKEVRRASDDLKRSIDLDDDDDRPKWKQPVHRPALVEPPQTASASASSKPASSSSLEPPPSIPGSALATEDAGAPVIVAAASAVAVGSAIDDPPEKVEETTDPQKPSSKEASSLGEGAK